MNWMKWAAASALVMCAMSVHALAQDPAPEQAVSAAEVAPMSPNWPYRSYNPAYPNFCKTCYGANSVCYKCDSGKCANGDNCAICKCKGWDRRCCQQFFHYPYHGPCGGPGREYGKQVGVKDPNCPDCESGNCPNGNCNHGADDNHMRLRDYPRGCKWQWNYTPYRCKWCTFGDREGPLSHYGHCCGAYESYLRGSYDARGPLNQHQVSQHQLARSLREATEATNKTAPVKNGPQFGFSSIK